MTKRKNLNALFSDKDQCARRKRINCGSANIDVLFSNIECKIIEHIEDSYCAHVAVLGPYFSNQKLLKLFAKKKSCTIVTTFDKYMKSKIRMTGFKSIKEPFADCRVKTLNAGRGRNKSILHTKAIILMDSEKHPYKVICGSFNYTSNASNNIENVTVLRDPSIAQHYLDEFYRVAAISKKYV